MMRTPSQRAMKSWRLRAAAVVCTLIVLAGCSSSSSSPSAKSTTTTSGSTTPANVVEHKGVTWMKGASAPGTPAKYDKVGVIEVGSAKARNVLVLEPGTSAGAAYFVPLAKWIVAKNPQWQVWSVERRENLLEDQSELDLYKNHKATPTQLFDYYLGYLKNPKVKHHFQAIPNSSVQFAKKWGMNVAVDDLDIVVDAAKKLGGKVVLGGHSLGGSVVTAYATWDFDGHAGADKLAGLVYIDGGSNPTPMSVADANKALAKLDAADASPWLTFGGIPAPLAGVFNSSGSTAALLDPNAPSLGQASGLLPADIVPKPKVTNLGQYGYALNAATSPPSLAAAQAHLGNGVAAKGPVHGWDGAGALTPIKRYATMFSGYPMNKVDGTEWYFPQRLTDDTGAVANGNANPAQSVLDVHATMGHHLPKDLLIYAFGAKLGGAGVPATTKALAAQSGIPQSNLTLADYSKTYAHNDPAGAYPHNAFFSRLMPFLAKVAAQPDRH